MPMKTKDARFKFFGDHNKFLQRIKKTLYYGSIPKTDCLSLPVTELAAELFSQPQHGHSLERLQCNDAAKISRNACVSPCSLVLAVLYLERLKLINPDYLQQALPSELFLVSLMISSKFLHDDGEEDQVFIKEWAASGRISAIRLIQLEKEFLEAIQWDIHVNHCIFWKKLVELEKIIATKEGRNRGWFTYTELENLLKTININDFLQYICGVSVVLLTTYAIGFLTILGAVHLVSKMPGNSLTPSIKYVADDNISKSKQNLTNTQEENAITIKNFTDQIETNNYGPKVIKKSLDAADVLKTGILLASIKSPPVNLLDEIVDNFDSNEENNKTAEFISWDWWNCTSLVLLGETSKMIETVIIDFKCFIYNQYQEKCLANCKVLDLEDQLHKATKVRIQDQIERSWHKEWTDMFKNLFSKTDTLAKFLM
ncbi:protein CNPPD1 [Agrilus planipennis]|uniref:Protein CNPPD1 n=1 Tax=Agrilus planipennis TaxID=224129 RepID=A0A1W4XLN8_AGRPL|nr:protein CNPPD1 [Agrilus planipennis]